MKWWYFYAPVWKKGAYCFIPVDRLVCRPSDVRSISFDPFAWKLPNLVQWMPIERRWSLLMLRSNWWSLYKSAWWFPNLVQLMPLEKRCSLLIFRSCDQRSGSNCWSSFYSLSYDPLLDGYKLATLVDFRKMLLGSQGQGLHLSIVRSIFYEPFAS